MTYNIWEAGYLADQANIQQTNKQNYSLPS